MSTNPTPMMSIVVPFYGDPHPTLTLIAALQDQHDAPPFEIIVSDDHSPTPFPETDGITVIRRSVNGGFGHAVNSGANAARGDYLLIINSDLEIDSHFLATLTRHALPWMPAVVSLPLHSPSGGNSWTGRHFPRTSHYIVEWLTPLARFRDLPLLHEMVGHDTQATGVHDEVSDWVVGALMFLPRTTFLAVNGINEFFYMNSEEVDLQRRLREIGIPSVVVGDMSVLHEGGGSSVSDSRIAWMLDGRRRYEYLWHGRRGLRRMEAGLLTASVINGMWNLARSRRHRDLAPRQRLTWEARVIRHPEHWVPVDNRAITTGE